MKSLIAFLIGVGVVFGAQASSVTETMAGKSLEEKKIRWLWNQMMPIMWSCMNEKKSCGTEDVWSVLGEVFALAPDPDKEKLEQWQKGIVFVSESERPDLFQSSHGEAHRLAVTENRKGATVYVNSDRLRVSDDNVEFVTIWTGILVHELTHHLGYLDEGQRWPDQIGSKVAQHVKTRWQYSDLTEFGQPGIRLQYFSPDGMMTRTLGWFETGSDVHAIDFGTNPISPACDSPFEMLFSQSVMSPSWKVLRIQKQRNRVSIKGTGNVVNKCKNLFGNTEREVPRIFVAELDLVTEEPIDLQGWWNQKSHLDTKSITISVNNMTHEYLPNIDTLRVKKVIQEKSTLQPGDVWKLNFEVESLDEVEVRACALHMTGQSWVFREEAGLPSTVPFEKCEVQKIGPRTYTVTASHRMQDRIQSDIYQPYIIQFFTTKQDRISEFRRAPFMEFVNPKASRKLEVQKIEVLGLDPLRQLGNEQLKNSFVKDFGKPFWIEITLRGEQSLLVNNAVVDFIVQAPGSDGLSTTSYGGPTDLAKALIQKVEVVKIAGGQKVRLQIEWPEKVRDAKVWGIRLRHFYYQGDDWSFAEIKLENENENMIFDRRILDILTGR